MKSIKLKIYLGVILIIALNTSTGCRKFVELDPPTTQLVTASVYASDATAISALAGIYANMVNSNAIPGTLPTFTGIGGDELTSYSSASLQVYQNALSPVDAGTNRLWTTAYNLIYQCNAVIEGCTQSNTLSPVVKKQLIAEATFIRAFWYTYLVNLWGDVPLLLTTDYTTNAKAARTAKAQVYQQIIIDLKFAQQNLNINYVDASSVGTTSDRIRPNSDSATALLARAYLYNGNYADAEAQASIVISHTNVYSIVDPSIAFLKQSKEAIWELATPTPTNGINTYEGFYFILTKNPSTNAFQNSTAISPQLLNTFEAGDKRKDLWIGKFTSTTLPITNYYFAYKYHVYTSSTITENSIVLRLAEQYLIRAEARAQEGKLLGAISDTDVIRNRAGLTLLANTNPNISKEDLLTAIFKERQTELFVEWGHRWIDLKRSGKIDAVMMATAPSKNTTWRTTQQLWPIPQKEITNDPNLVQNPGYN